MATADQIFSSVKRRYPGLSGLQLKSGQLQCLDNLLKNRHVFTMLPTGCENVNFARRDKCNKCGKEKKDGIVFKKGGTEIGKVMAEKSKGLFSADDWQCKSCGNVNWSRRGTCNMCNTPKYGKNEQRTGYGGGYMEREVDVEYKETKPESDDEYDLFGRKKKKNRLSTDVKPAKSPTETRDEEEKEEKEEGGDLSAYKQDSEEEDDDDVDLGQYDLGASDDDDPKVSKTAKRSRSASGSSRSSSSSSSSSRSRSSSSSSSRSSRSGERKKRKYSRSRSSSRSREQNSRGYKGDSYSSDDSVSRTSSRNSRDSQNKLRGRRSRS